MCDPPAQVYPSDSPAQAGTRNGEPVRYSVVYPSAQRSTAEECWGCSSDPDAIFLAYHTPSYLSPSNNNSNSKEVVQDSKAGSIMASTFRSLFDVSCLYPLTYREKQAFRMLQSKTPKSRQLLHLRMPTPDPLHFDLWNACVL